MDRDIHDYAQGFLRNVLVLAILSVGIGFTSSAIAQTEGATEETSTEKTQRELSNVVLKTAGAIDNFFSNSRYSWADNKSRVT